MLNFNFTENFEQFLKMYLNKYKYQSIDSDVFKNEFTTYFATNDNINNIDWDTWLNKPGMPPVIPEYDQTLSKACNDLRTKWINWDESDDNSFSPKDISDMNTNQVIHFTQLLLECDPIPISKLKIMDKLYNFSSIHNSEIRFRWIRIGLKAHWMDRVEDALSMVTEVGRMKFIRPLYQDLYKWEEVREKAIQVFKKNHKDMMHVSAYTVSKDLHLE